MREVQGGAYASDAEEPRGQAGVRTLVLREVFPDQVAKFYFSGGETPESDIRHSKVSLFHQNFSLRKRKSLRQALPV
jgi:hypothetical protein